VLKMREVPKYRGNSKKILPPSAEHDFTVIEIDKIVQANQNRELNKINEPKDIKWEC